MRKLRVLFKLQDILDTLMWMVLANFSQFYEILPLDFYILSEVYLLKTPSGFGLPAAIWECGGLENVAVLRTVGWRPLVEGWWWWWGWWWGGVTLMELRLSCSSSVSLSENANEPALTSSIFWRWPWRETGKSFNGSNTIYILFQQLRCRLCYTSVYCSNNVNQLISTT